AHAHHVAGDFGALVVAHAQHHRIFPGPALGGVPDHALDLQCRRARGGRAGPGARGIEAQVVLARGTDARAFEDRGLAVRAGARGTCHTRLRGGHGAQVASSRVSAFSPLALSLRGADDAESVLSQPHSTWPRILEPAATVSEPALMSPVSTAESSSSTLEA